MKYYFLIDIVDGATILPAMMYSLMGREVYYYQASSGFKNKIAKWWLNIFKIKPFSLQDCQHLDVAYIYGDLYGHAEDAIQKRWDVNTAIHYKKYFKGVKNIENKLYALFRADIYERCRISSHILTWIKGQNISSQVRVLVLDGGVAANYFKSAGVKTCPRFFVWLLFFIRLIFMVLGKLANMVSFGANSPKQTKKLTLPGKVQLSDVGSSEVLFFPHQTIGWGGGLYYKEQFYNEDLDSIFHSSNILHVELGRIPTHAITPDLIEIYQRRDINYCILPTTGAKQKLGQMLKTSCLIFRCLLDGRTKWETNVLLGVSLYHFINFKKSIVCFKQAKLALIGYDMLFPRHLSLALESEGIKTIATQERYFSSTFYKNWCFIIDTYLVGSKYVCTILNKDSGKVVNSCINVGLNRTDTLFAISNDKKFSKTDEEKMVAVYDYHSCLSEEQNNWAVNNNWQANLSFYKDIIKLAKYFSDVKFVIRSRDTAWHQLEFFADIRKEINDINNLECNLDYSHAGIQYELAMQSTFIIAKHTSLVEEYLAFGKQVVIHDYFHNASKTYSRISNYDQPELFANNYQQLKQKVSQLLDQNVPDINIENALKNINGKLADGQVKNRIQKVLEAAIV